MLEAAPGSPELAWTRAVLRPGATRGRQSSSPEEPSQVLTHPDLSWLGELGVELNEGDVPSRLPGFSTGTMHFLQNYK